MQAARKLERPVYTCSPKEMDVPRGKIVKFIKRLYDIPESPTHWFSKYATHHKTQMGMEQLAIDPCVMYAQSNGNPSGLLALQVDDSLYAGTSQFMEQEEKCVTKLPSDGRTQIEKT